MTIPHNTLDNPEFRIDLDGAVDAVLHELSRLPLHQRRAFLCEQADEVRERIEELAGAVVMAATERLATVKQEAA